MAIKNRERIQVDWSKEYNSAQEDIIISEYGRHVQNLVAHAKTIANPTERQQFAERIIWLMMQISPQSRNVEDYREKLWKHLFRIGEYELDVAAPDDIVVTPDDAHKHPEKVPYPESPAKYRHYGHNVQRLIQRALEMPEGPKRDGFIAVIGAYMKLAYKTWNREHYVGDEVIKADLATLSDGLIQLDEDVSLDNLSGGSSGRRTGRHGGSGSKQPQQQRGGYSNQNHYNQRGGGGGGGGGRMRQQQQPTRRNNMKK